MNTSVKNFLGAAAGVALIFAAWSGWRYASFYGASIEPSSFRSFSVTSEGKTVVVPDIAELGVSVTTEGGTDVGSLQAENTKKMNKIIDFVKSTGVNEKDIQTQSYSIQPRYQTYRCVTPILMEKGAAPEPCPPAEIVGYTIQQNLKVKVRDFKDIGDILSGVVREGANTVSGPSFTIDDPATAEQAARTQAIEKAQAKAGQVAKAGGFSLGRLLSIEEGGSYPKYARGFDGIYETAAALSAPAPSIEPGSEEVRVTVTLRYEIR